MRVGEKAIVIERGRAMAEKMRRQLGIPEPTTGRPPDLPEDNGGPEVIDEGNEPTDDKYMVVLPAKGAKAGDEIRFASGSVSLGRFANIPWKDDHVIAMKVADQEIADFSTTVRALLKTTLAAFERC